MCHTAMCCLSFEADITVLMGLVPSESAQRVCPDLVHLCIAVDHHVHSFHEPGERVKEYGDICSSIPITLEACKGILMNINMFTP